MPYQAFHDCGFICVCLVYELLAGFRARAGPYFVAVWNIVLAGPYRIDELSSVIRVGIHCSSHRTFAAYIIGPQFFAFPVAAVYPGGLYYRNISRPPFHTGRIHPQRIDKIHRVVFCVWVWVCADERVVLEEAAGGGVVGAGAVVVEGGFGVPLAAGVGEGVGDAGAGFEGYSSESVVAVFLDNVSLFIGKMYHGAAFVVVVIVYSTRSLHGNETIGYMWESLCSHSLLTKKYIKAKLKKEKKRPYIITFA